MLIGVGFVIGVLGGFFGVGGSFLAGPALLLMGVKANFTVGTDLAHIVGKSIVAAKKHRALGNVDLKLGGLMVLGTLVGVELGVGLLNRLKRVGDVERAISVLLPRRAAGHLRVHGLGKLCDHPAAAAAARG